MNISIKYKISNIRSEIKIPSIIFSGYGYYYLKHFILINKHTANENIDKIVDIYSINIIFIFIKLSMYINKTAKIDLLK